ncbi:MAG: glucans biosynthesis glucosyltransferase MdoH, partial [Marinomonas sp.]
DLEASYEEAPPSLIDVMVRDRRWCQGNLQHKAFLLAQDFHFATRVHLFSGIFSYLSAVFWFLLIAVGFALAVQAHFVRPEYFSNPSLFPTWPVFDFQKALLLFELSMALVLAPKVYGWLSALLYPKRCMSFGGPILLTLDTLLEVALSALYAPILMFSQFLVVFDVLKGRDSGWKPQSRDDGATPWKTVARAHLSHTLLGAGLASAALFLSPALFYWSLPITIGLVFSIPLSWLSGGEKRGNLLSKFMLLRASQEKRPTGIVKRLNEKQAQAIEDDSSATQPALQRFINDVNFYHWYLAQLPQEEENTLCRSRICAQWQIEKSANLEQLTEHLQESECLAILKHKSLMLAMGKYLPQA